MSMKPRIKLNASGVGGKINLFFSENNSEESTPKNRSGIGAKTGFDSKEFEKKLSAFAKASATQSGQEEQSQSRFEDAKGSMTPVQRTSGPSIT
jgi:hypothetical protein